MPALRALRRLARCVLQTCGGLLICALLFPRLDAAARMRHVAAWSARMLDALDVERVVVGTPHPAPAMLVANHVSWIDILALNAAQPVRFVAKAEVRGWPLLGWLVERAGTLFIERERPRDALRVVHRVADALRAGESVAFFPEGTTSTGHALLPFHANLLQSALSARVPIQPVVLRYDDAREAVSAAAAYVGETSLLASLGRVLRAEGLRVHTTFLVAEPPSDVDRRRMAERLHARIAAALAGDRAPQPLP